MGKNFETAADFARDVVRRARDGWVNEAVTVAGKAVQVKAYGKWVQALVVNGGPRHSSEFGTQRDMREFITTAVVDAAEAYYRGCPMQRTGLTSDGQPQWEAMVPGRPGVFGATTREELEEWIDEMLGGGA